MQTILKFFIWLDAEKQKISRKIHTIWLKNDSIVFNPT